MAENLEIKAYLSDVDVARVACQRLRGELRHSSRQRDTYFHVSNARLKFRETSGLPPCLIAYSRVNAPLLRESKFEILPLASEGQQLKEMLARTIGTRGVVIKHREVYVKEAALINIDVVEGLGNFVEIEVDVEAAGGSQAATEIANKISSELGLSPADAVSWSYIDMLKMYEVANTWRNRILSAPRQGVLILLDGASGTGKTTLAHMLLEDEKLDLAFICRFSTREPRRHESTESEYIFLKREEFEKLAQDGELLEYRDFDFGMSYGLAWQNVAPPLLDGRNALGIMNLGSVRHVKKIFPEALTIFIDSSPDTIRERLIRRGVNDEAQIAERVASARKAEFYRPYYDHVINNEEGHLEEAAAQLKKLILENLNRAHALESR